MVTQINQVGETKKLNIKYKGSQVVMERFTGNFTKDQIRDFVQKKSNALKKAGFNGKMSTALYYPDLKNNWRTAEYLTPVGDNVVLYNYDSYEQEEEEPGTFHDFQIYYFKDGPNAGGCDSEYNDCLYNCLKKAAGEYFKFDHPAKFKRVLKLTRKDKIPIELMPDIEHRLNTIKINVTGDHIYTSTKQAQRVINLKLLNGHYKLLAEKVKVVGIAYDEKTPLMYDKLTNGYYTVYDDEGERQMSKADFDTIKKNPQSSKYIIIPREMKKDKLLKTVKPMKEQYDEFIQDADLLKEHSNGLINMYKTGTVVHTVLKLFNDMNQTIAAEPIKQTEAEWIHKASIAALIFADKYEGPAYDYDVVSHYPALMIHKLMFFPIKEGEFNKLSNEEFHKLQRLPYGIYRCKIDFDQTVYKQFRYNKMNYYTHIDLTVAKELNLNVTMIEDNEPNQLIYKRSDLVTGYQLFKPYVDMLFKLKDNKVSKAKDLINVLWGALTQKNVIKQIININSEEVTEIREDRTIMSLCPINDNETKIEYYKNETMYQTNYGRIAPFILARGRQLIGKYMKDNIDSIVRCHTDGFLSTKQLNVPTGSGIGELKYKGYCEKCIIHNNIKVEGEFIL